MDVRARINRRFFSTRARRRGVVSTLGVGTSVGAAMLIGLMSAGAATTNGDPVLWAQTQCVATLPSGAALIQNQDVTVAAVVPNNVAASEAYSATIPGGTANLPATGGGFTISGFKDISQTYLFRSSTGTPAITGTVAGGSATNNGNPVAFTTSFTNEGTTVPVASAAWTATAGGTITYTTAAPHGLSKSQTIDILGFGKAGYNAPGGTVANVPTPTTFTTTGRVLAIQDAVWSAANGGTITFTTFAPHLLKVGDNVTTINSTPTRYNRTLANGLISSVPSPTQFTVPGGTTDPGPIVNKGSVDTLADPGATGPTIGAAHTLTTAVLSTATAAPGTLTVPDVSVSLTAPSANATVTTYGAVVTTTATLVPFGDTPTVCRLPHSNPQTDGISATLVGAGGPTTTSSPACRPPDVCATTTTTLPPGPTVTSLSPTSGSTAGGTSVAITGTNLTGATSVNFGGTAATSFTVNNSNLITATAPAAGAGTVDLTVTTPGGTSAIAVGDQYTFVAGPAVTSVSPTSGPATGGTSVTVTGTDLTGATGVSFGGTPAASFTVDNATQITASSPASSAGAVDITVTTPAGTSATSANDQFTFVAGPAVTGVSPTSGPAAGGTSVTVTGTDLTGATAVSFGGTPAASFTVDNATQITASSPASSAGAVDITVTTVGGTSATSANDQFTFVAAPTVTGVSPTSGPTAGGTSVTVTGTDLTGATAVSFGGIPTASFTVDNATQITASSPASSAGAVDITVTTAGGTSATSANDQFTFVATGPTCGTACITVGDKAMLEMDFTHGMILPVTLSQPATQLVTVQYAITSGSATGGIKPGVDVDFKTKTGTLTWKPSLRTGLTGITKTISATVFGDLVGEPDDTFTVTLSNPTGGYGLGAGTGTGDCGSSTGCATGTILNDDGIAAGFTLGVGDGSIFSARSGAQSIKLPVTLSGKAGTNVSIDYTVVPGTATYSKKATDGGDYGGKVSGTLTFLPNQTIKQIALPIWPDAIVQPNQGFTIMLTNLNGNGTGVTLIRMTGNGTILGLT